MIRVLLLLKSLFEDLYVRAQAEGIGALMSSAVRGDLVMLDLLRGSDQTGIPNRPFARLTHNVHTRSDERGDGRIFLVIRIAGQVGDQLSRRST
jgi:hypothetical protein